MLTKRSYNNQQQIWNLLHRCYVEFFEHRMRGCFYDQYSVLNYTYNQNGYITHKGDSKTGQYEDYVYED